MKTIPIGLAAHYAQPWHTVAYCLKVTNTFGGVRGFTSSDAALVFDGVSYDPGFNLSSLASSNSLAVDNMELTIVPEEDVILVGALLNGIWDNSAIEIFEVNVEDLTERNLLKKGTLGVVRFMTTHWVVELRSLAQALQQTQGIVTQKTCRARLGDSKCTLDLGPFTFAGTIDSSTDRRNWVDAARTEGENYFAEGILLITAAANPLLVGFTRKVKSNSATGEFVLSLPMPYDMTAGDTYSIIAGCMKRRDEDCVAKFANVLNFQAEPDLPGLDNLTKPGAAQTQADSTPTVPAEGGTDGAGSDPDGGE